MRRFAFSDRIVLLTCPTRHPCDELAQTVSRFGRNAGQVADGVAAAAVDAGRLTDNADEAAFSLSRMDPTIPSGNPHPNAPVGGGRKAAAPGC